MEPRCSGCGAILDTPCECMHALWLYQQDHARDHYAVDFKDNGELVVTKQPDLTMSQFMKARQELLDDRVREDLYRELYGSFSKPLPEPEPAPRSPTHAFVVEVLEEDLAF